MAAGASRSRFRVAPMRHPAPVSTRALERTSEAADPRNLITQRVLAVERSNQKIMSATARREILPHEGGSRGSEGSSMAEGSEAVTSCSIRCATSAVPVAMCSTVSYPTKQSSQSSGKPFSPRPSGTEATARDRQFPTEPALTGVAKTNGKTYLQSSSEGGWAIFDFQRSASRTFLPPHFAISARRAPFGDPASLFHALETP